MKPTAPVETRRRAGGNRSDWAQLNRGKLKTRGYGEGRNLLASDK
jgi:hypothetical protein